MTRRKKVCLLTAALIVLALCVALFSNMTDMRFAHSGAVVCPEDHEGKNVVSHPISDEDLQTIKKLLNHHILYQDSPACGFTESIAITFNDGEETFCLAMDSCEKIYWVGKDRFFSLSARDYRQLAEIAAKYGMRFFAFL